ncbi:MAG: hypothetical protein K0V04_14925 [Deltaproteobacteria bacterium]|nr:hypothetical protein [Deltaproteobacteria bacterium]
MVWLVMGAAILLASANESRARLQPYYVLRTAAGDSEIQPRILFVLDTSGSMSLLARNDILVSCQFENCEDEAAQGTDRESRLAAARRAVREVLAATEDNAKFALMTFIQNDPHAQGFVPQPCALPNGDIRRFVWTSYFRWPFGAWFQIRRDGHQGAWRLCQGNQARPYPYLRWDDLGVGSVINTNNEAGAVPSSPLIDTSFAAISDDANAQRRVQWFPEFMGVRFHPDDTTDPGRVTTYASAGDYGVATVDQDVEVWEHDFYYWPYVDGFPGYGEWDTFPFSTGADKAGIAGNDGSLEGKLYSPFYLDLTGIPLDVGADLGPGSEDESAQQVLRLTSPLIEGGVDSAGVTPWYSTVGAIPGTPTYNNGFNTHNSIASYLAFVNDVETPDVCAPTAAVLVTDGAPYPATEGGARLYERLAALRTELNTQVYVVGFFHAGTELNDMACAAAGACDSPPCATPCDDAPADAWDTCADPDNPNTDCAYLASSADELQQVLNQIIGDIGEFDVPAGPGSTANEFEVSTNNGDDIDALQTSITASTEYPSWRGHVIREACDLTDENGDLLPQCVAPNPEFADDDLEERFGPCLQSRTWDAGQCLADTTWSDRRVYTNDSANNLILVSEPDGTASGEFVTELQAQGLVSGGSAQADANEIVAFLLGRDAPDDWKLPGLANSAPIIVRRIPPYLPERVPSVGIRDPHCGGRLLGISSGVPPSLEDYAASVWDDSGQIALPSEHFEAQEAVLVGDDFSVLHAFQLNSGNELWAYIPRYALESLQQKSAVGAATYGQVGELEEHSYGLAATLNRGWVYDDTDPDPALNRWRQLAIIGMGPGGNEHAVLDLSHMSPESARGPFEIMWTTEDAGLAATYDQYNGQTWARPALGYHVPNEISTQAPDAFFVMGTGYPSETPTGPEQGRTLMRIDALTGQLIEYAVLPDVTVPAEMYEPTFGTVVDAAVTTHCLSRLWAEMQEVYLADPAGRLFRWDLGRETNHAADSGGVWGNAATMAFSDPLPACIGSGVTCSVSPGTKVETFAFPPAVSSIDRLDDISSANGGGAVTPTNQFLVALIGGTTADDALREGDGARYHSSIYVMVDDHQGDATAGFDVPVGAPKADAGTNADYMRVALTDVERTRIVTPYDGAAPVQDTRNFSRGTRPLRAPRIYVTGVVDDSTTGGIDPPTVIDGVEVYWIEFTVYEPPAAACDAAFYDPTENEWHPDPGSTYRITFRLTADVASGFDLINGANSGGGGGGSPANFGGGYSTGLTLDSVEQLGTGDCPQGGCGAQLLAPSTVACDNNTGAATTALEAASALAISHKELSSFSPIE